MVRVTVVIPTHNRPTQTHRAVRSVLDQACDDIEVLVVDDGSTPPYQLTADLARHGNCRVLRLARNRGPAAARNVGMRNARGTWLAFLDSDDVWIPNTLAQRLAAADADFARRQNPLAVYGCAWQDVTVDGEHLRTRFPRSSRTIRDFVSGCWFAPGSTCLFRRSQVLEAVGGQDEQLPRLEDFDWFLRLSLRGGEYIAQTIVGARIEKGEKPGTAQIEESVSIFMNKWSRDELASQLPVRSHRLLRAYFDLERASSAWFHQHRFRALLWLARSFLQVPRTKLSLGPGWTIERPQPDAAASRSQETRAAAPQLPARNSSPAASAAPGRVQSASPPA